MELTKELDRIKSSAPGQVSTDSAQWGSSKNPHPGNLDILGNPVSSPVTHDVAVPSLEILLVPDFKPVLDGIVLQSSEVNELIRDLS